MMYVGLDVHKLVCYGTVHLTSGLYGSNSYSAVKAFNQSGCLTSVTFFVWV